MLASIGFVPTNWIALAPQDHVSANISQPLRAICYYTLEVCFTFTLWGARLSILWTIIRITPPQSTSASSGMASSFNRFMTVILNFRINRKLLYAIAVLFFLFALVLNAQKFWVCVGQTNPVDWAHTPGAVCTLTHQVAVLEIASNYPYPVSIT